MSQTRSTEVLSVILGTVTATSIGSIIFQALGVFLLGILGAFAGWFFNAVIKPWLERKFIKKNKQKAE